MIESPRLSYGLCPTSLDGHVYFKHGDDETAPVESQTLRYDFDLLFGPTESKKAALQQIVEHLWKTHGHPTFADVRPQVLPFEEYGRRYTYVHELPASVRRATINGQPCVGIDNAHRRGANFHAWENDLHVAYGVKHYAEKWQDAELNAIADGILNLSLNAPRKNGAFPCIYNFDDARDEGTLYWTARAADAYDGYDTAAMSVSAWWLLQWHTDLQASPATLDAVLDYARFLVDNQLPSGSIPTYFYADLRPAKQLFESATTAINGAVLAKTAGLTGDETLCAAALAAGQYINAQVVPDLDFSDFETFYSCSPKPLHAMDYWTGIRPHNNLSLQWSCDFFLALYQLTKKPCWLETGQYLLNVLSLYQQIWNPSHLPGYLYGGFGVMNTDGEWHDGRQARFVSTYADYYSATGKLEYLERAVAACRAGFALMDTIENHANAINDVHMEQAPGLGYAPENIHHSGANTGYSWTGMNWSSGGALAASAYLERRFGNLLIDLDAHQAIPIDGLQATIEENTADRLALRISSPLKDLPHPYVGGRDVVVVIRRTGRFPNTVVINDVVTDYNLDEEGQTRLHVRVA